VFQSVSKCFKVFQSVSKCFKMFQSVSINVFLEPSGSVIGAQQWTQEVEAGPVQHGASPDGHADLLGDGAEGRQAAVTGADAVLAHRAGRLAPPAQVKVQVAEGLSGWRTWGPETEVRGQRGQRSGTRGQRERSEWDERSERERGLREVRGQAQ